MKDTKYRFFLGAFVGFILAGFFFFFFFYRGANAQPRPVSPPPRAAAPETYELPPNKEKQPGNVLYRNCIVEYTYQNGGISDPAISPDPVEGPNVNPQLGEPVAEYSGSPEYGYSVAPPKYPARYYREEPPLAYNNPSYVDGDPSKAYPEYNI